MSDYFNGLNEKSVRYRVWQAIRSCFCDIKKANTSQIFRNPVLKTEGM